MLKKLDKLIVKAFIGPFVATFFITLLVLVMQFFWLYIDDFVGKGLNTSVIFEFIWYKGAALVPLALPLAVLLSSIMTFGNLGESMELVAIKSAGISLLRFMRPLMVVSLIICGIAFLFANYIIPVANLKSNTMLADIVYAQPAFDIKEGVFYNRTGDFAIKIGKKEKDSIIKDVIIFERSNNALQDNFIVAKSGIMRAGENKRFLQMILKDGWRYQERGTRADKNTDFIRMGFKEYKKDFDISSLLINWTNDSVNKNQYRMLSMRQLNEVLDSMKRLSSGFSKRASAEVMGNFTFAKYLDSGMIIKEKKISPALKNFDQLLPDSSRGTIKASAAASFSSPRLSSEILATEYNNLQKSIRLHKIEWHKKITYSIACLVLFMIGAPLGSIIRKGGLGLPLVFAIVFFMIFYFLNTMGEKFAKEAVMSSFNGMWLANFILLIIGLFLTYKALKDSQLFNKESYLRAWRRVKGFAKR